MNNNNHTKKKEGDDKDVWAIHKRSQGKIIRNEILASSYSSHKYYPTTDNIPLTAQGADLRPYLRFIRSNFVLKFIFCDSFE